MSDTSLRVTHVIPQIGIGGAEMQLCRLVSLAPPERATQSVLFYSDSLDESGIRVYREAGIDFERIDRGAGIPFSFLMRLAATIRRRQPDILHCWLPSGALWGRWAAALTRVRHIILSFRNTRVELANIFALSRIADGHRIHYLVNSTAVASAVAKHIGVQQSLITVIPNGVELAPSTMAIPRQDLLRRHGCPPSVKIVLTVGRLTDQKNYSMLLRVAALCRDQIPAHFFIAGHGEREADLRAMSRQLRVDNIVHFLGLREDVPDLLHAADAFCYTSRYEGFPNAVLEAMAAGCPIVTTRFLGVEDLIDPGVTGLVVGQDDEAAAFVALRSLLTDLPSARALGDAARKVAESRFSMEKMVEATLRYYERILGGTT